MAKQINCECGYVARGESDDEVVQRIREHMRTDHPELLGARLRRGPPGVDRRGMNQTIGGSHEHSDV